MKWLNFLHLYQPANQQRDILESVVVQCYRPLIGKIYNSEKVGLTINITGSLLELFERDGFMDLIEKLKDSVQKGKIEITGSARYHAFLPLIPEDEIRRQIESNNDVLRKYLGNNVAIKGFFPPEMAVSEKVLQVVNDLGFEWVLVDEIAFNGGRNFPLADKFYSAKNKNLKVFFRNRRISNLIMSAAARNTQTLDSSLKNLNTNTYLFTAMDGETFGHHRPGLEKLLFEIIDSPNYDIKTISSFIEESKLETGEVDIVNSTWASSMSDIEKGIQFISWKDPENEIHAYQWELFNLVLSLPVNEETRDLLDMAMSSDHFWWASAKPWWSLEMIEEGAFRLLEVVKANPQATEKDLDLASELYRKIVSTAAKWQRSGKVREMHRQKNEILRIPFKERTLGKGGSETAVYEAFINLFKEEELKAAKNGEYEKAILWRDAVYKIENKSDIYDAINAIDLLRIEIGNERVEKVIKEYKDDYNRIRGGQPEQRSN